MSKDRDTLLKAYITYVRPLMEYGSPVWSPHLIGDIKQLEAVQKRFTKRLHGMQQLDYPSRLAELHIDSLELRRLHFDLIYTYKLLFGLIDLNPSEYFSLKSSASSDTVTTRGHPYSLHVLYSRTDIRKYFFF